MNTKTSFITNKVSCYPINKTRRGYQYCQLKKLYKKNPFPHQENNNAVSSTDTAALHRIPSSAIHVAQECYYCSADGHFVRESGATPTRRGRNNSDLSRDRSQQYILESPVSTDQARGI
jgi:hypothetical protein